MHHQYYLTYYQESTIQFERKHGFMAVNIRKMPCWIKSRTHQLNVSNNGKYDGITDCTLKVSEYSLIGELGDKQITFPWSDNLSDRLLLFTD